MYDYDGDSFDWAEQNGFHSVVWSPKYHKYIKVHLDGTPVDKDLLELTQEEEDV